MTNSNFTASARGRLAVGRRVEMINVAGGAAEQIERVGTVAEQAAVEGVIVERINRR